jgi:NhaA family Na+:H+ antiporter
MAVFFLLVGLEIKRELVVGELSSAKQAALPIACAIGGMIVPAAIYWMFNKTGFPARGWGIPMATDIAFALSALALIAPRRLLLFGGNRFHHFPIHRHARIR